MPRAAKLTEFQSQFINEYVIDFNGTQAVHRARTALSLSTVSDGVAAAQSTKWLKMAKIRAGLADITRARNERTQIDQDWVVHKLVANVEFAESLDQPAAVNGALTLLARHTGGFFDKPLNDEQAEAYVKLLEKLRGLAPPVAPLQLPEPVVFDNPVNDPIEVTTLDFIEMGDDE